MALEAVVFPQDPFVYKDHLFMNLVNSSSCLNFIDNHQANDQDDHDFYYLPNLSVQNNSPIFLDDDHYNFNDESVRQVVDSTLMTSEMKDGGGSERMGRRRQQRRRGKTQKNKEEIENQRMTHIVVERNRRKQMNEYLSTLRSLMPHSYVQRVPSLIFLSPFFSSYILSLSLLTYKRKESSLFFFFLTSPIM